MITIALAAALAAAATQDADAAGDDRVWAVEIADTRSEDAADVDLAGAKRVDVIFEGYFLGVRVGKMSLNGLIGPRGYELSTKMRTTGVVSLVANTKQWGYSAGRIGPDGPVPLVHQFEDHKRGETPQKTQLDFRRDDGRIRMWADPPRRLRDYVGPDDVVGAVDPLSGVLQAGLALGGTGETPCSQTARMFDGRRRFDMRLEPDSIVELSGPGERYQGRAYKCRVRYDQIAGFKEKNVKEDTGEIEAYMYFADLPEHGVRVPVKAVVENGLASVTLLARDISVRDASTDRMAKG